MNGEKGLRRVWARRGLMMRYLTQCTFFLGPSLPLAPRSTPYYLVAQNFFDRFSFQTYHKHRNWSRWNNFSFTRDPFRIDSFFCSSPFRRRLSPPLQYPPVKGHLYLVSSKTRCVGRHTLLPPSPPPSPSDISFLPSRNPRALTRNNKKISPPASTFWTESTSHLRNDPIHHFARNFFSFEFFLTRSFIY